VSKQIWKFALDIEDRVRIPMPAGAEFLSVQMQGETPCLWALVDPDVEKTMRYLDVYGTGHTLPDNPGRYISTFQMMGGRLVFHAFEPANATS
jgi:hypothetical protein